MILWQYTLIRDTGQAGYRGLQGGTRGTAAGLGGLGSGLWALGSGLGRGPGFVLLLVPCCCLVVAPSSPGLAINE